ncbi:molybdopterin-dependent oxidoreductase [Roseomonas sp. NAR14]|uniref:Molybdopterin-dependent oxidoreductase n=1 Tax=Roseomonas acroporae TaxID=2937791 RepID=A0A9X1YCK6_9PROT|nr:molybdopterin-dependent oxidoreductase [Roseomonas acroporae]MCK8786638.1 molybdopterin-dependent oxidoreductase [Roseomonas acroporae]
MIETRPHSAHWGAFDAVVEDGRLIGVRPFSRDPVPGDLIGAMPAVVHAPSRIDRPYVRKGWLEGGRRGSARGGDAFVPVSWDSAVRLVAEETARVRAEHGDRAILGGSYGWSSAGRFHHARSQLHRFLGLGGGFTGQVTNYSYGAGMTLLPHLVGTNDPVQGPVTDWTSIAKHTRLMLCLGGLPLKNGLVTAGGSGAHEYVPLMRRAVAAGVRFVNVSPFRGDCDAMLEAEWIPIRPNTDCALLLGMAHAIVQAGWEDRSFLATRAVGWERLRAYLLGEGDGIAKTPEWAAAITGVPAETIRRLALEAASVPTMLTATWSVQRAEHGEQPWWMLVALAAMLGGIGRPGQGFGFGYGSINGMGTPRQELPSVSLPGTRNPANLFIPVARVTELLERPGEVLQYNGRDIVLPDIRMIWWAGGNPFHHHQDLNRLLRGWNRADTVVVQEPWWTAVARHADIVLPATTTLERNDIASSSRDRFVRAMHKAIPAQGQARDDHAMLADIADALGFRDRFTEQRDEGAWLRHLYGKWRHACAGLGVEVPDFDEFWARGHIEFPAPEGKDFVLFEDFARDPEANPLNTPSGKVEIFSETVAGFGYAETPGHPVWHEPREYLGSPLAAKFPLHLLSYQPATRLHGQLDPGPVAAASKIAGREPILMHPDDAAARGLAEGEVVRIFNDRGACLGGLRVSEAIRPGVVAMATGAWFDPEVPGSTDSACVHGNPNVLTQDVGTSRLGQGCSAQSCLVEIERWRGALPPVRVHAPPAVVAA